MFRPWDLERDVATDHEAGQLFGRGVRGPQVADDAAAAAFARSDLSIPEAIAKGMSLYLIAAIGLKGGVEVNASGFTLQMLAAALAGVALSFLLPLPAFLADRRGANRVPRPEDVREGFTLTGYFLAHHFWEPRGLAAPEERARFVALGVPPA